MKFIEFAGYLQKLEKTASRNSITEILADLFKTSSKDEIDKVTYLALGTLAPSYRSIIFGIADQMVIQSISKAYEIDVNEVKSEYKKLGDLGDVSVSFARNKKQETRNNDLSINQVYEKLVRIANEEGEGSQDRKIDALAELLTNLDPLSAKYVTRIPIGKLRLGFSDKTILDALSWVEFGDKSASKSLNQAFEVMPDIGLLVQKAKDGGIEKVTKNPTPILFVPVMPALAQRIKSPTEMIKKMGDVAVEPKFDGLRALIHIKKVDGKIKYSVFTRNLNDVGRMFPELLNVASQINADEVILDSEAVGMDSEMLKMVDFQTTMQRRRKHDIAESSRSIPLRFQVFDLIYKDGESLMDNTYEERRGVLSKTIKNGPLLVVDDFEKTNDPERITFLHKEWIKKGLEGVIVKKLDSKYVSGRTGWRWVKMKEEEEAIGKLSDTIDVVVLGFTSGKGKRVDFGMGQFLAGVVDGDKIKTITKVGTGLTDEQFKELKNRLEKLVVSDKPAEYVVHKDLEPHFWVEPKVVVELAADEITVSPKHSSGYALRFPRLVKFRDDKGVDQASTISELKRIFKLQKS